MKRDELIKLVKNMTLYEKVSQLLQITADFYSEYAEERTGPLSDMGITEDDLYGVGSVLGISGASESIRIQKEYLKKNRLKIPLLFMADIIHGYRTIFPIPLALGCTWDTDSIEEMARISAKEAAVSGIHVTFSPMVDLVRDPRWGRVMESTGEDPLLNSVLSKAFVRGYQSDNLKDNIYSIASCVKHFAAYGAVSGGRDYNSVDLSELKLREQYLSGYSSAIQEGAKLVMTSFNTVNGIPSTGNKWLLKKILREDLKFNGTIISDWGAVKELIPHGVAASKRDAAKLAINVGVDIEMMTTCYKENLEKLIKEGEIEESLVDESVLRILELKNDLGLFENPNRGANEDLEKNIILSKQHRDIAKKISQQSIVLLKNESVLPLSSKELVAVIGPGAHSLDILGAWSWKGKSNEAVSLVEGMKKISDRLLITKFNQSYFELSDEVLNESLSLAKKADKVVLALGEESWMSGEAASRSNICLPPAQVELFNKIKEINPNIIVTLYNGRPLDLNSIGDAKGIVEAWFPGTEGGNALAEILFGIYNPSGKLSMSFPDSVGQVPIYYNCENTGRPYEVNPQEKYVSKYLDISNYAKYPFGYGLSYCNFTYSNIKISNPVLKTNEKVIVSVDVCNESSRDGVEIVQLYIRDKVGEVVRPIKELKDFKKIYLEKGENRTVSFDLDEQMLRYVHSDMTYSSDEGEFVAMVGSNSQDYLEIEFLLDK